MKYKVLDKYLIRTPAFEIEFKEYFNTNDSENMISYLLNNLEFKDSIMHSSINLYTDFYIKGKRDINILNSIFKYFIRSFSRSTPFGLFSKIAVGTFGYETDIVINDTVNAKKHIDYDMEFLICLYESFKKEKSIIKNSRYRINSSCYRMGPVLRYLEYSSDNFQKKYKVSSIDIDDAMEEIIEYCNTFQSYNNIVDKIMTVYEYSQKEVEDYIDELIECQIIVSYLEPITIAEDYFNFIYSELTSFDNSYNEFFSELKRNLDMINTVNSSFSDLYNHIITLISSKNISVRNILNITSISHFDTNSLENSLKKDIQKAFNVIHKISVKSGNKNMSKFIARFKEKYDNEMIPLSIALDEEIGVGYVQNNLYGIGSDNPLLENLEYKALSDNIENIEWHPIHDIFLKKYITAIQRREKVISINSAELDNIDSNDNINIVGNTISTLAEIFNDNGKEKFYISSFGYSSAINPISRFYNTDEGINKLINDIAEIEGILEENKIIAEVIHTSSINASNNILIRPRINKYDLLYLGNSNHIDTCKINIDDIYIKIDHYDNINLFSKKLNSNITVRLTSTHNYKQKSLPVYNFLCDLQEEKRKFMDFNYLPLRLFYIPRIEIDNIIFQKERWSFFGQETKTFLDILISDNSSELKYYRRYNAIPNEVLFVNGDQEVWINFNDSNSIKILKSLVKNTTTFILTEVLQNVQSNIVKSLTGKSFASQFMFSLYKPY